VQACNLPKLARKEGPFLYKNQIQIEESKEARLFTSNLDEYIKQRPNKRLFFTSRFGLRFYKMGYKNPDSRIGRTLQTKLGEAPVILDSSLIEASIRGMKGFLKTQGYYYPEITFEVKGKIHKKVVVYKVKTGKAYHIYRTELHIADKKLDSLVTSSAEFSHIRLGNRVYFENMLKEKNRINELLRNNGYFSFQKDIIKFDVDTAMGDFHANIAPNIPNPENFKRYKTYHIRAISLEIENEEEDSLHIGSDSLVTNLFVFKHNGFPLNPEILDRVVLFEPGNLFSNEISNTTFSRLNELQLFRSVNMTAIPIHEETDTPGINYVIKLQPSKKYDFTFEPQAITSDQSNLVTGSTGRNYGLASQITFSNKNIFHNAEILQLSYRISVEAQRGENIPKRPIFNSYESNLSATLIFPKLLFLRKLDKTWINSTNRSSLSASTIYEKNVNWIRNVYGLSFTWQKNKKYFNQYFTPAEVSYIKTNFNSVELEEQSKGDPYLQSVFSNNLVTGSRYGFIYNNQSDPRKKHFTYIKWDVIELAGTFINQAYKLFNIAPSDSGYNTFFGVQYFQFAKTNADLRYNRYLDENNRLASRLGIGIALPFGNSPEYVPFDKRFFTGGANSIRAFLPRSIGPGSYDTIGSLDRSGDVKLEMNLEHRFNILNHFIEGAIFVDAGNIWRIKDDGRKDAVFAFNNFYKQLAVGTGLGVRLNMDFLILRVDASFPILDPRKVEGSRYVLGTYSNVGLLWQNTIFNFGVGYPF
jgi:outer membrane protein assembly factor BamA